MVLDRRPAQRDLVGKPPCLENVLSREPVVTENAPALAHPDRWARRHQHRMLETTHPVAQEPVVLLHLTPPLDLGAGELVRVGGVDVWDASHVNRHHTRIWSPVPRTFETWHLVSPPPLTPAHPPPHPHLHQ